MTEYERLSRELAPNVTRGDVAKVLRIVQSDTPPWDWFARARVPFPTVVAIIRALSNGAYLEFDPTRLTERGVRLAAEVEAHPALDLSCPTCDGSGTDWRLLSPAYARYLEIFQARPRGEDPQLDQGAMTPESLFRRLALMIGQGDIAGREIAALGDDDLASIALALTGLVRRVTVFELDPRICEFIESVAREQELNIRVRQQDLAARLPGDLLGGFDTFVCDPPETEAGLTLFVEKGLALLRGGEGHAGYFGATVIEASLSKWRRWQLRLLGGNEIAFTHILPPFTEYEPWPDEQPLRDLPPLAELSPRPWYRFAFYRLETLPDFRPLPDFEMPYDRIFYFDQESYYEAFR